MPKVKGGKYRDRSLHGGAEKAARKLLKLRTTCTEGTELTIGTAGTWEVVCASAFDDSQFGLAANALIKSQNESIFVKEMYLIGKSMQACRVIVVYWHNIPNVADASGTLPGIDDLLVNVGGPSNEILGSYLNKGVKHTVLFDKCYDQNASLVKEIIPVKKTVAFVQPPDEAQLGGHYDSATVVGQVSKGLICVYYNGGCSLTTQLKYY